MVTVVEKSNGKRLSPWETANVSFHSEEEARAKRNELVRSARLIPPEDRKKWSGKDLYEPGEIFFINTPTDKGVEKLPYVYHEPVVDLGDHFEILDEKTHKLVRRLTHAIVLPRRALEELAKGAPRIV